MPDNPNIPYQLLYKILVSTEAKLFFYIKENLDKEGGLDMTAHRRKMFIEEVERYTGTRLTDTTVNICLGSLVKISMLQRVGRGRYKVHEDLKDK